MKINSDESRKLLDAGVFIQPPINLYNKFDHAKAQTLLAISSDGIFTNTDLYNKGYDVNFTCSNCHQARDTIFHRCFSCPFVEHKARLALGDSLFNVILEGGDASIKGKRCLFPMPVRNIAASAQTVFSCFGMDIDEKLLPENGKIYGDGSCLNPSIKGLARAGWAIVQVNEDGDVWTVGKEVEGGWHLDMRFSKRLFEDPEAGNKLQDGYVMGFNIGMDDDDKFGPGTNGDGSRSQDLELQYFWGGFSAT